MKKKVLHIQVIPKISGVQRISLEIFKGLSSEFYDKWILFGNSQDSVAQNFCKNEFEKAGVKVLFSKKITRSIGFNDFSALFEIYKLCRNERFDIVHTHSTKTGFIGRIAATLSRTQLVVHTVHGFAFHKYVKFPVWQFYWICEMFASMFCHKIVMVNKFYGKYLNLFSYKLSTIYNAIDFSTYSYKELDEKNNDNVVRLLYVGRLDFQKDPLTMLKAVDLVLKKNKSVFFTIVGDGEMYGECDKFIKLNFLEDKIRLVGWQDDVSSYYASHDIFISSSIYEAFGLIFLEAGFHQLPSIATNVEGIPEVINNGITGLLSNPRNPQMIADNILKLVSDKEYRIKMGEASRINVVSTFTIEKMVNSYIQIYNGGSNV